MYFMHYDAMTDTFFQAFLVDLFRLIGRKLNSWGALIVSEPPHDSFWMILSPEKTPGGYFLQELRNNADSALGLTLQDLMDQTKAFNRTTQLSDSSELLFRERTYHEPLKT